METEYRGAGPTSRRDEYITPHLLGCQSFLTVQTVVAEYHFMKFKHQFTYDAFLNLLKRRPPQFKSNE